MSEFAVNRSNAFRLQHLNDALNSTPEDLSSQLHDDDGMEEEMNSISNNLMQLISSPEHSSLKEEQDTTTVATSHGILHPLSPSQVQLDAVNDLNEVLDDHQPVDTLPQGVIRLDDAGNPLILPRSRRNTRRPACYRDFHNIGKF